MVAAGFAIVCIVCVSAAPTEINFDGATIPAHLSLAGYERWAGQHPDIVICDLPSEPQPANLQCGPNGPVVSTGSGRVLKTPPGVTLQTLSPAAMRAEAVHIAGQTYEGYRNQFLYQSNSLMVKSGLWLELEAIIGFIVGLGLASLIGQRTVAVILMIVLELILTPIVSMHVIPHLINLERGVVGLATLHLTPGGIPLPFGGGGGGGPGGNPASHSSLVPESITVAVCVIVAWLVGWTALGAWRMMTRDA
jgi:hypothetical protein